MNPLCKKNYLHISSALQNKLHVKTAFHNTYVGYASEFKNKHQIPRINNNMTLFLSRLYISNSEAMLLLLYKQHEISYHINFICHKIYISYILSCLKFLG